ncbi:MAG: tRNA threonylcarbamoyladenosine dehydratase [Ruminococcaceae bacterium]|nr:tRNA threonylcarbamoyladenosine dehydratase [Oscillospiraceae bacterium]
MTEQFSRTYMLLGEDAMDKLRRSHILLFGLGGVGASVAEALCRCGVGNITLVDNDKINPSNINRQIIATSETIGLYKTEATRKRLAIINPECKVTVHNVFYLPSTENIITADFDYIIDAIDTVTAKIDIIMNAKELHIPVISCMGTGNKLHPELLEITDLFKTSVCPLCRVMRTELKKRGLKNLTVVYSPEMPLKPDTAYLTDMTDKRQSPGSVSFVPPAAGLLIVSKVIRDLIGEK